MILMMVSITTFGAPAINSVSGTISPKSTLIISGASFGARSNTPFYFDDFEKYAVGTDALHAGLEDNGTDGLGLPHIQVDKAISGTKSMRMDYLANKDSMFPRLGKQGMSTTEVYVSMWTYITHPTGTKAYPIMKLVRAGSLPTYSGFPGFYETIRPNPQGIVDGGDMASMSSDHVATYAINPLTKGQNLDGWHRTEYYFKLSTPGVADGIFQQLVDGSFNMNLVNTMNRSAGSTALVQYVMSPFDGNDSYNDSTKGITDNSWQIWLDDFYIDTTRARVEIGEAATFTSCKVKFIQPSTNWTDNTITVNTNIGNFTDGKQVYVYVISADGSVNTNGYPIIIGSNVVSKPKPPSNLVRN